MYDGYARPQKRSRHDRRLAVQEDLSRGVQEPSDWLTAFISPRAVKLPSVNRTASGAK